MVVPKIDLGSMPRKEENSIASTANSSTADSSSHSNKKTGTPFRCGVVGTAGRKLKKFFSKYVWPSRNNDKAPRLKFAGLSSSLRKADYDFVEGLLDGRQSFVLTDPTLPDNPVIMASQAFLNLTRYPLGDILGRNCRFLQGPETSQRAVAQIRAAIQEGADCSVCLVNYRKDGSTFWNDFYITSLRDNRGRVKNYIGVLCEVSAQIAAMRNEAAATQNVSSFSQVPKCIETSTPPASHEAASATTEALDTAVLRMPKPDPPMERLRQTIQERSQINEIVKENPRKHEEEWLKKREAQTNPRRLERSRDEDSGNAPTKNQKVGMLTTKAIIAEIEEYANEAATWRNFKYQSRRKSESWSQRQSRIVAEVREEVAMAIDAAVKRQVPGPGGTKAALRGLPP